MLSFRRKKPESILGIDFRSTSIQILELSGSHGQYCVEGYTAIAPLDTDAIKALKLSSKKAVIAVPDSSTISKIIQINASVQEQDLEEWVIMEAEKFIPYPLDDINIDFNQLGPSLNNAEHLDVLVVACRSECVNQRVEAIQRLGLVVQIVDVESYAIERAASALGNNIALFDIGESYTRYFVFNGKKIIFSREEAVGLGALPELLLPLIKRALQFFFSINHDGTIAQILLSGDLASIPGLTQCVYEALGIPTQIANPFIHMTFATALIKQIVANDAPQLMVACGLALHGLQGFI